MLQISCFFTWDAVLSRRAHRLDSTHKITDLFHFNVTTGPLKNPCCKIRILKGKSGSGKFQLTPEPQRGLDLFKSYICRTSQVLQPKIFQINLTKQWTSVSLMELLSLSAAHSPKPKSSTRTCRSQTGACPAPWSWSSASAPTATDPNPRTASRAGTRCWPRGSSSSPQESASSLWSERS